MSYRSKRVISRNADQLIQTNNEQLLGRIGVKNDNTRVLEFDCFKFGYAILINTNDDKFHNEHQNFIRTLRHLGIDIIVISNSTENSENLTSFRSNDYEDSDYIGNWVFILNGVALILKSLSKMSSRESRQLHFIQKILTNDLGLQVICIDGTSIKIASQDILFTGKEIFVGVNNTTTNIMGAQKLAAIFQEYSVQVIEMPKQAMLPLKNYVSVGGNGFLLMCQDDPISKQIVDKICLTGKFIYEYLSLSTLEAVNSLFINNALLHLDYNTIGKSSDIINEKVEIHAEISLMNSLKDNTMNMQSLCILVPKHRILQNLESILTSEDLSEYLNC